MANSPINKGNQTITFAYQQEGTARGFNKILHGILPRGIISGGELSKNTNSKVNIAKMQMLIGDDNVTAHVETADNIEGTNAVDISQNKPYIVATYDWEDITDSYVNFTCMDLADIRNTDNVVILGMGVFNGSTLSDVFDYTRKSWTSAHYNNDFGWTNQYSTTSPSFNVIPKDNASGGEYVVIIEKGEAIIGGNKVVYNGETPLILQDSDSQSSNYFNGTIAQNTQRYDIVVIHPNSNAEYIMGTPTTLGDPINIPKCPSNSLTVAILNFSATDDASRTYSKITGDCIEYIPNNHYYGGTPTLGKKQGTQVVEPHCLFL